MTAASSACLLDGLLRRHRPGNHQAAIKMVTMQGGVFGAVADSKAVIASLP